MAPGPIWALRACAAIALTVASFVELRNRYHGGCLIPGYQSDGTDDLLRFLIFPTLFLIGFIWSLSELVYPWLLLKGMRRLDARWLSIALGLAVYAAVSVGWMIPPVPVERGQSRWEDGRWQIQEFTSVFWSVRVLAETGNFSHTSCGY
jgi:hypothetical protein